MPSYGEDIGKSSATYPQQKISDYPEEMHSVARLELQQDQRWLLRLYHHYQDWSSRTARVGDRTNLTRYRGHTLGGLFYRGTAYFGGAGRWGLEWTGRRDVSIDESEFDPLGSAAEHRDLVDGEEDAAAFFLDQQWTLERLRVGAGLRYDHIGQSHGSEGRSDQRWNVSTRGEWQIDQHWAVNAELGTAFRSPGLTELYFNGVTPRGDILGNPRLEPEKSRGVQLGLDYRHSAVQLKGSTYYKDLEDYIERYRLSDEVRCYRNLKEAAIWGFELEVSWQPTSRWLHQLSYQWQRGEDEQGGWLADLTPPSLFYLVRWQGQTTGLSSELNYRQARSRFGPGEVPVDAALASDLGLDWNWRPGWRLSLYADNVLDRHYVGAADEEAPFQPGRSFGLRLEWLP